MAGYIKSDHFLEYYKIIGRHVCEVRKNHGLTQEAMSRRIGYSRKHISSVETGKRRATMDFLLLIEKEFNVPIDDILKGTPTEIKLLFELDAYRMIMEDLSKDSYDYVKTSIRYAWKNDNPDGDFDKRLEELQATKREQ